MSSRAVAVIAQLVLLIANAAEPQINGISPGSGQSGSVAPVTINGSNFGSSAAALSISGIPGTVSSVNSGGTQISASFNPTGLAPGTHYVVVNLSNGTDVEGDNILGMGTTKTSWNLQ